VAYADPRPALDRPLSRLLAALCRDLEGLGALDPSQVLPVAVSAHGAAAASVRSLDDVAASVKVDGKRRRWELALRPPFFLAGDPTRRLATLVHELLHLDPTRPGQLLADRRHRVRSHEDHEQQARALAREWLSVGELTLLSCLGHHGEVLMRQWKRRPVVSTAGQRFGGRDLFVGPVRLQTPARYRSVWW
jgi:hypothetical protein